MSDIEPQGDNVLRRFAERLEAVGGHVAVAADENDAAEIIVEMARTCGAREVIAADELSIAYPALKEAIERAGLSWRIPSKPADARDAPLGVSLARLAVAETGSVLLAEETLADRAIGLMCETHLVVCPNSALVLSLDEAAPILRALNASGAAYATLVTGPSRTADIERQLTIGVQGPAAFHVLLLDGAD